MAIGGYVSVIESEWKNYLKFKQILMAEMRGKRSLGKPRIRWEDTVMKNLKTLQEKAHGI